MKPREQSSSVRIGLAAAKKVRGNKPDSFCNPSRKEQRTKAAAIKQDWKLRRNRKGKNQRACIPENKSPSIQAAMNNRAWKLSRR